MVEWQGMEDRRIKGATIPGCDVCDHELSLANTNLQRFYSPSPNPESLFFRESSREVIKLFTQTLKKISLYGESGVKY